MHPSSSSANSSFHATFGGGSLAHNGSGRHFRQRSEPLIPLEQQQPPPPMQFHHSRTSSSTTSGEGSIRGFEAIGGARRKQQRHHEQLSLDKIQGTFLPTANFMLGHGSAAPKMMSSPTRSIDMGYHTLNGDTSSSLEPWDTSLNSINLTCPAVRTGYIYSVSSDLLLGVQKFMYFLTPPLTLAQVDGS